MKKFLFKFKIPLAVIVVLIVAYVVCIPFNVSHSDMKAQVPANNYKGKASVTFVDYQAVTVLVVKNRHGGVDHINRYLGFWGKSYDANEGALSITADMLTWIPSLMDGAKTTVSLSILSVAAGLFLSIFIALGKMSKLKIVNPLCRAYVFFFRGTPLLMQLYFIYYGLPQISPSLAIDNAYIAAFIAFSLNSAAYCAEIIRAAIESIDKGQFEASKALGMSYAQTMKLIVIPQSFRRLIPPVSNEFIMVLKDVSLVSMIALIDITKATRSISSSSGALVFLPAMVLYLIITYVFTKIFSKLEEKYSLYE